MSDRSVRFVALAVAMFCAQAAAQVIPASRVEDWSVAGYPGPVPEPTTVVDATAYGAVNDGSASTNAAVKAAIQALGGQPGVVLLPAGTYLFTATVSLPSGVVLRGAGSTATLLEFDLNDAAVDAFSISGSASGGYVPVASGYERGSTTLTLGGPGTFAPGDYAELHQANGAWDTNPATWAVFAIGQIVRVVAVDGAVLTLETPLRTTYDAALAPEIRKLVAKVDVGLESFKVQRVDAPTGGGHNVRFTYAARCWLKDVESAFSAGSHVMINASTRVEVTGCYVHEAFGYDGSATRGYGVTLDNHAGEALVENNVFRKLRHAMMTKLGANGNVVAYNYSRENFRSEIFSNLSADISLHGHWSFANLFEGNIVQTIMVDHYWGASGPYNTFFRNRTELFGLIFSAATGGSLQTASQNVVGNELMSASMSLLGAAYQLNGADHLAHGNQVGPNVQPAGTGNVDDLSYYRGAGQPWCHLAAHVPPVGLPNGLGAFVNRARERWDAGGPMTWLDLRTGVGADVTLIHGESTTLVARATGGRAPLSFQWLPEAGLDDPHALQPVAAPLFSTTYTLTVTDAQGCARSHAVRVTVTDEAGVEDVDECLLGVDACSPHADCENLWQSYACACRPGYAGDGFACEPTCAPACAHGACAAPDTCACDAGWTGGACDQPICAPACAHGACAAPDTCACDAGWTGGRCDAAVCGDGLTVGDEQCEAGGGALPACCDPLTCRFASEAVTCRPATGDCDAPEACPGADALCPPDVAAPDGSLCVASDQTDGACFAGACEVLAANDDCGGALALRADEPVIGSFEHAHADPAPAPPCPADLLGPDLFFVYAFAAGEAFTVRATPDAGLDVALVTWSGCAEAAACLAAVNDAPAGADEALALEAGDTGGALIVQVLALASDAPTAGFTLVIESAPPIADEGGLDAVEPNAEQPEVLDEGLTAEPDPGNEPEPDLPLAPDLPEPDLPVPDLPVEVTPDPPAEVAAELGADVAPDLPGEVAAELAADAPPLPDLARDAEIGAEADGGVPDLASNDRHDPADEGSRHDQGAPDPEATDDISGGSHGSGCSSGSLPAPGKPGALLALAALLAGVALRRASRRAALGALAVVLVLGLASGSALAAKKGTPKKKAKKPREPITITADVGVGPAAHFFTGPLQDDQVVHAGLKLDVQGIIDQATIRANQERIPKKWRKRALQLEEFRLSPFWWLPDTLVISPKLERTQMYGVVFRPLALGLAPLRHPVRFTLGAGLLATYLYVDSSLWTGGGMHFLRPGLDLRAELELPLGRAFALSLGWASAFYVPQEVGSGLRGVGEGFSGTIWHVGQAFVLFHFRFPYDVRL